MTTPASRAACARFICDTDLLKTYSEYYHKAMQIIQCPTSVINLEEGSNIYSNCLIVPELIAPLIHVREKNDYKYGVLVHELQHGINHLVYGYSIPKIYKEL